MHKKNFTLYQIAAGALALFLWIFVALSQNPTIEKIYTLPVEFSGMNEDFVLLESDFHVQVRLSGMEFAFENLQTVNMKAHVDLFDLPAGKHNVNVNLSFPDNLQLVSCTPDKIAIELEEKKTKPFNVSVEIGTPTLPAGYNVMSPIASPIAKASPKLSVFANLHLAIKLAKANTMNKITPITAINQSLRKRLKIKVIIAGTI